MYVYFCLFIGTELYLSFILISQFAKQHLLRCFMNKAVGHKARNLIDQYPDEKSSCFAYNKALLEFISNMIGEEENIKIMDAALDNGTIICIHLNVDEV